ncbi:MAG: TPM domain-containing protein [Deltaproteobacteria bacterium]|nr:TPM domain-containing protein [Candidatus Anaeroferrophillacea bacterium]
MRWFRNIGGGARRLALGVLFLAAAGLPGLAAADNIPARPPDPVVDLAGIIDAGREGQLNRLLRELERRTGAQVAVLTVKALDGRPIDDLALEVAHDRWRLGRAGVDNGALLLIATGDRRYRFEIGYGLEGILPDSMVGSLGRDYLVPWFRQGDFGRGIAAAVSAMALTIANDAGVTLEAPADIAPQRPVAGNRSIRGPPSILARILSIIFFIILAIFVIRNPRLALMMLLFSAMGGRNRSWGGGGGGGFGGGGFGGGGGGFGGGGASGGW